LASCSSLLDRDLRSLFVSFVLSLSGRIYSSSPSSSFSVDSSVVFFVELSLSEVTMLPPPAEIRFFLLQPGIQNRIITRIHKLIPYFFIRSPPIWIYSDFITKPFCPREFSENLIKNMGFCRSFYAFFTFYLLHVLFGKADL